jgi:hypothetical protein
MNFRFKALSLAAGLVLAASAQAAPVTHLGTVNQGDLVSFIGLAGLTNYDFTFVKTGLGDGSVTATFAGVGHPISNVVFDGVTLALPAAPTPTFQNIVLFDGVLTAGLHTFSITSTKGYIGQINAAVPEPESIALALAGLGVVGFVMRRRVHA